MEKLSKVQEQNLKRTLQSHEGFLKRHADYQDNGYRVTYDINDEQKPIKLEYRDSPNTSYFELCYLDCLGDLHYVNNRVITNKSLGVMTNLSMWLHANVSNVLGYKQSN